LHHWLPLSSSLVWFSWHDLAIKRSYLIPFLHLKLFIYLTIKIQGVLDLYNSTA
jgi:hypothetical protein